ncbi:tyrosine-type recombinase/integrase [Bacillus hominis]|uniref:tyrosine-type recombinase/integrase n=1 Tax=Bacillus cereus group TaxID=86661 RepID=UPI00103D0930|nr:site-specific integrase [Bacillus wiedmannii]TCD31175.1 site-specific integrase [Bacillus wiedmannii]
MAGSIEKRGKDSWRLTVPLGYDQNGKQIKKRKTVKASGIREAKKLLTQFEAEILAGEYIDPQNIRLADFIPEWRSKYAVGELSPATLARYDQIIKGRILPEFGHMKLDKVKPLQILGFLEKLKQDGARGDSKSGGLSSGSIQYHHRVLKNIFSRAVEWQLIKDNPVAGVKKPKVTQAKTEVYNKQDIKFLLMGLEKESVMWQILIKMALTTGMRRGELLGLEWEHIDLSDGVLSVEQTLNYTKDKGYFIKEPKTRNSVRKLSLPKPLLNELKKYRIVYLENRMKMDDMWKEGEHFFLFTAIDGKPLNPSSVYTWWGRFIKKNNLPYIRFHDLRHTSATLLINEGAHMKTISNRLGHASISTTMNIYGHALKEADQKAADMFNHLFDEEGKNA